MLIVLAVFFGYQLRTEFFTDSNNTCPHMFVCMNVNERSCKLLKISEFFFYSEPFNGKNNYKYAKSICELEELCLLKVSNYQVCSK